MMTLKSSNFNPETDFLFLAFFNIVHCLQNGINIWSDISLFTVWFMNKSIENSKALKTYQITIMFLWLSSIFFLFCCWNNCSESLHCFILKVLISSAAFNWCIKCPNCIKPSSFNHTSKVKDFGNLWRYFLENGLTSVQIAKLTNWSTPFCTGAVYLAIF